MLGFVTIQQLKTYFILKIIKLYIPVIVLKQDFNLYMYYLI
jgi:hypothetical protein